MKIQLLMPWNNLGCLGFRIGRFYVDFFRLDYPPYFAAFANTGRGKYRWSWRKGFRQTEQ